MKTWLYQKLEILLHRYPAVVWHLLEKPPFRQAFLRKFLLNRPHLLEDIYRRKPADPAARRVFILKPDAVGDFVLFFPFLRALKSLPDMQSRPFVLLGNALWEDLARDWCQGIVEEYRFFDRSAFRNPADSRYRNAFLFDCLENPCHTLIYPVHSRESLAGDWLAGHIPAVRKISARGDTQCQPAEENGQGNSLYNVLLTDDNPGLFETELHLRLFRFAFPGFPAQAQMHLPANTRREPFVALFPGAGAELRRWPAGNFRWLARKLLDTGIPEIRILGGPADRDAGETIAGGDPRIRNLCGQTTLPELALQISSARFLVSNETGAIHMAALFQTPALCLSNGNHYGRFNPWQMHGAPHIRTLYPPAFEALSESERIRTGYGGSRLSMEEITPDRVWQVLETVLGEGG